MDIKLISNENTIVEKIIHISDIHIRLYQRMKEYKHCFRQLYEKIETDFQNVNAIIVITGDIVHCKNELSPECDMATFDFLNSLSKLKPTIIIAGNHDALLNNRNRIDTLSSILHQRNTVDLFYLRDTGIYSFENITFYVDSLLDDKIIDMTTPTMSSCDYHIGLYHGGIQGWRNVKGYVSEHGEKYVEDFAGMDYVLLGDIHMMQYMSRKKPITAYSGSLISQDFGETDVNHGMLIWDLPRKTQQFIPIDNPYRFQDVYILPNSTLKTDGKVSSVSDVVVAPYGQIKVFGTVDEIYSKTVLLQLQSRYKEANFHFHSTKVSSSNPGEEPGEESNLLDEMKLVEKYISDFAPPSTRQEILQIIQSEWRDQENANCSILWEIRALEFSNLFGYGADNKIDFTKTGRDKCTIGIFGSNSVGKSTIIDIISLLLFDKVTRLSHGQTIPKEVIHFEETDAFGKITISIGSDFYMIEKKYKRLSSMKIKLTTKFYHMKNNEKVELTGEQRKKTNAVIEQIIGKYDIFIYINSYLQQREQSFRDMIPSMRKKFLNELYGYQWFTDLERKRKDILRDLETRFKLLSHDMSKEHDASASSNIESLKVQIQAMEDTISDVRKSLQEITKEKESLLLKLHFTEDTYFQKKTELDKEQADTRENLEQNKKLYEKSLTFIETWKDHFLTENVSIAESCPIYQQWSPNKTTCDKWNLYFDTFKSFLGKSDDYAEVIRTKLKQILKDFHAAPITYCKQTLQLFDVRNKDKLLIRYQQLCANSGDFVHKMKQLYNNLQLPIDSVKNPKFYETKKQEFATKLALTEKQLEEHEIYLREYETLLPFFQTEHVQSFIEKHLEFQSNSIFKSLSPFFDGTVNRWKKSEKIFTTFRKEKVKDIREQLLECSSEIDNVEAARSELSKGRSVSRKEYENALQTIQKPPFQCVNCSFEWTDEHSERFQEYENLQGTLYFLKTEIKMIMDSVQDVTFQPNPKCQICLNNKQYKIKVARLNKVKQKEQELHEIHKKERSIKKYFQNLFHKSMDVHFSQNCPVHDARLFKKRILEKEHCKRTVEKESTIHRLAVETIQNYENRVSYEKVTQTLQSLRDFQKSLQHEYDKLMEYMENYELYVYLQTQWKWYTLLQVDMETLREKYNSYTNDYSTIQSETKSLQQELSEIKSDQLRFSKIWENDTETMKEIEAIEKEIDLKEKLEKWIYHHEQKRLHHEQQSQCETIQKLEKEQSQFSYYQKNAQSFHLLDRHWRDSTLWDIDPIQLSGELKESQRIVDKDKETTLHMELYEKSILEKRNNLSRQWELDQSTLLQIQALEKKRTEMASNLEMKEHTRLFKILELEKLQQNLERFHEKQTELYNLQRQKDCEATLCKVLDKDGLPLFLLKQKMEDMQSLMNELIAPFLPKKKIRFFIDQKTIEFGIVSDSEPDKLCTYFGGMESFIIELVVKLTFSKFSILPRSNFFIIDEGISVLDQQNVSNICFLFNFLSSLVTNVLLISHLPQIQDFVDKSIHISKHQNKSHVSFCT